MPLRLINPYYKTAVEQKAEQHAPAVDAWLQGQTSNRIVTLAELRAGLPAIAAELTRPVVNQIARLLNVAIDNPEDTQA